MSSTSSDESQDTETSMEDQQVTIKFEEDRNGNDIFEGQTANYAKIIVGLRKMLAESRRELTKIQCMKDRILALIEAHSAQLTDSSDPVSAARRLVQIQHILRSSDAGQDDVRVLERCVDALKMRGRQTFDSFKAVEDVLGLLPAVRRILFNLGAVSMKDFASELDVDAGALQIDSKVEDEELTCANVLCYWIQQNPEATGQDLQKVSLRLDEQHHKKVLEDIKVTEEELLTTTNPDQDEEEFNTVLQGNVRVMEWAVKKSIIESKGELSDNMMKMMSFLLLKDMQNQQNELVSAVRKLLHKKTGKHLTGNLAASRLLFDAKNQASRVENQASGLENPGSRVEENTLNSPVQPHKQFLEPPKKVKDSEGQSSDNDVESVQKSGNEFHHIGSGDLSESPQHKSMAMKPPASNSKRSEQLLSSKPKQVENIDPKESTSGRCENAVPNGNIVSSHHQQSPQDAKPKPSVRQRIDYQRSRSITGDSQMREISPHTTHASDVNASLTRACYAGKARLFRAKSMEFLHRKRLPIHVDGIVEEMKHRFEQK